MELKEVKATRGSEGLLRERYDHSSIHLVGMAAEAQQFIAQVASLKQRLDGMQAELASLRQKEAAARKAAVETEAETEAANAALAARDAELSKFEVKLADYRCLAALRANAPPRTPPAAIRQAALEAAHRDLAAVATAFAAQCGEWQQTTSSEALAVRREAAVATTAAATAKAERIEAAAAELRAGSAAVQARRVAAAAQMVAVAAEIAQLREAVAANAPEADHLRARLAAVQRGSGEAGDVDDMADVVAAQRLELARLREEGERAAAVLERQRREVTGGQRR